MVVGVLRRAMCRDAVGGWLSKSSAGTAVALVPPGLEELLRAELSELGVVGTVEPGGVAFSGDPAVVARVNQASRIATRVLLRTGRIRTSNLEEIARGVVGIPWKDFVVPGQPIEVESSFRQSRLRADAADKKLMLAIGDALRGPRLPGPRPPREPFIVHLKVEGDHGLVSVDTSGERLTIRGWREATAKAPLRENLAAAALRVAGWTPGEALVDPMCGSGTFVIEAARMALGLAPRVNRTYAYERFPAWKKLPSASYPEPRLGLIWGSDRDAGGIRAAQGNAKRAKVTDRVRLEVARFEDLEPPAPSGLLIANPPWGLRIGDGDKVPWERWGERLLSRWGGWRVAYVIPQSLDLRRLGWRATTLAKFESGGIPIRVVGGTIP